MWERTCDQGEVRGYIHAFADNNLLIIPFSFDSRLPSSAESLDKTDEVQLARSPGKGFRLPREALKETRIHAGDTLASCTTGVWFNVKSPDDSAEDIIFPLYRASNVTDGRVPGNRELFCGINSTW